MNLLILNDTELHPTKISNYDFHHSNSHVTSTDCKFAHFLPSKHRFYIVILIREQILRFFYVVTYSFHNLL